MRTKPGLIFLAVLIGAGLGFAQPKAKPGQRPGTAATQFD
jgi:hypothetical protein